MCKLDYTQQGLACVNSLGDLLLPGLKLYVVLAPLGLPGSLGLLLLFNGSCRFVAVGIFSQLTPLS